MSWVRLWRWALLSVFVGFFLTACGDENEPSVPALSADSGDSESSADTGDEQVGGNEETSSELTNEADESSPPTECELSCIEQYEEMISAEDCDAWCHATSDQWLSGCLATCSSNA